MFVVISMSIDFGVYPKVLLYSPEQQFLNNPVCHDPSAVTVLVAMKISQLPLNLSYHHGH